MERSTFVVIPGVNERRVLLQQLADGDVVVLVGVPKDEGGAADPGLLLLLIILRRPIGIWRQQGTTVSIKVIAAAHQKEKNVGDDEVGGSLVSAGGGVLVIPVSFPGANLFYSILYSVSVIVPVLGPHNWASNSMAQYEMLNGPCSIADNYYYKD